MPQVRENPFWGWLVPALLALSLFFSFTAHLRVYTGGVIGPGEVMMGFIAAIGWIFCRPCRFPFGWRHFGVMSLSLDGLKY